MQLSSIISGIRTAAWQTGNHSWMGRQHGWDGGNDAVCKPRELIQSIVWSAVPSVPMETFVGIVCGMLGNHPGIRTAAWQTGNHSWMGRWHGRLNEI